MKKQATYHKEKRMVTCQRLLDTNFCDKHIEKDFCICYNANRQKRDKKSMWAKEMNPQIGMAVPSEDSSFLL